MEDTPFFDYWPEEAAKLADEADQYSYYMHALAREQAEILNEIRVLERILEDKRIRLKKVEYELL